MMELKQEIRESLKEEIRDFVGVIAFTKIVMDAVQPGSGDVFVQLIKDDLDKLILHEA